MEIRTLASSGYSLWEVESTTSSGISSGYIEIEPNSFQMISIPINYGYWDSILHTHIHDDGTVATVYNYIIQQVEDIYSVNGDTMIEVFNTLVGGQDNYLNFVVGITNPASPHNFQLSYYDVGVSSYEYTGFFIKSIHSTTFTIQWGDI